MIESNGSLSLGAHARHQCTPTHDAAAAAAAQGSRLENPSLLGKGSRSLCQASKPPPPVTIHQCSQTKAESLRLRPGKGFDFGAPPAKKKLDPFHDLTSMLPALHAANCAAIARASGWAVQLWTHCETRAKGQARPSEGIRCRRAVVARLHVVSMEVKACLQPWYLPLLDRRPFQSGR